MRMYKIKNKLTGEYYRGTNSRNVHRFSKEGIFLQMHTLNYMIERAVTKNERPFLDSIEIVSYKLVEVPGGVVNIKNIRDRHEKNLLMQKLRN